MIEIDDALPGADLVRTGLGDLSADRLSIEALVVAIAWPRLRRLGVAIPPAAIAATASEPCAELQLYQLLRQQYPRDAYARYNALIRRLIRFCHALEQATKRAA